MRFIVIFLTMVQVLNYQQRFNLMKFIKRFILILLFIFPISNSFGAMMTFNQKAEVHDYDTEGSSGLIAGIEFNNDGTKMFISYANRFDNSSVHFINEYNLTIPYDISTKVYTGDSKRCEMVGTDGNTIYDLDISSDGMRLFVVSRRVNSADQDGDKVYGFDLTSPYDISSCLLVSETENLDNAVFTIGSNAGDFGYTRNASDVLNNLDKHRLQSIEINNDGSKLFLLFMDTASGTVNGRLYEFNLSTPYDVSTLSIVTSAGIEIGTETQNGVTNPAGMRFSPNGKRLIITSHAHGGIKRVLQVSLSKGFDTSSFTIDGSRILGGTGNEMSEANTQTRAAAFSGSGLKVYIGSDRDQNSKDEVYEYDLVCPFNIISGKCPLITDNKDRTAMMEAQIEIAKRTIDHSTDTALNRLKWIRRNKDNQNFTNLNIDLNFNNQILNSLTKAVKTSTTKKKKEDKKKDIFYWSEGSIAVGRIGDSNIASAKKIGTDAITVGADRLTNDNGIQGLAFRVGRNDVDIGTSGSNLDTDTYNLTYYATSPFKDDTKFLDTIFGIGGLSSNLLNNLDGKNITADRNGGQIYGTIRIKDEIKKNNLILIPSGRFDIGHTILDNYKETGNGAIKVEKQHVRSKKIRAGLAAVEDLSNDNYTFRRHGKLEYVANIDRSSNFKYTYVSDTSKRFNEKLKTGSLHNLSGEIGIDIIMSNSFSIFLIYERNQELGTGYTDKMHIALGYLPNENTNYALVVDGIDEPRSNYIIKKKVNDFSVDFKLTNNLMNPTDYHEASLNLIRKF